MAYTDGQVVLMTDEAPVEQRSTLVSVWYHG
jgi:hypothetical protein